MSNVVEMPDRTSPRGRVAAEVRAEMARARVSARQLSRHLGKSQAYWWRRLSGETPFDVEDLYSIAGMLDVPVTAFFEDENGPHPTPSGGQLRGRKDSNPQPSGLESDTANVLVLPLWGDAA